MERLFTEHAVDAVIHFAGHKAVGESVAHPLMYYRNNYDSALTVLEMCIRYGSALVFSSSATVYGVPQHLPLTEEHPLSAVNPYGRTKLYIEETIRDVAAAHPDFNVSILRYFNPVGAHESGLIGENPNGIPNNLMPFICQTAAGIRKELQIFGGDYNTPDGTGVRDYIHVTDLISGHIAALRKLETRPGCIIHNLGTGRGTSVLEMVRRFEEVNGVRVPYRIVERRAGDRGKLLCRSVQSSQRSGLEGDEGTRRHGQRQLALAKKQPVGRHISVRRKPFASGVFSSIE